MTPFPLKMSGRIMRGLAGASSAEQACVRCFLSKKDRKIRDGNAPDFVVSAEQNGAVIRLYVMEDDSGNTGKESDRFLSERMKR